MASRQAEVCRSTYGSGGGGFAGKSIDLAASNE